MKSSRASALIALILLVILVVWVSLYVMADKSTTPTSGEVRDMPTPQEEQAPPVTPKPVSQKVTENNPFAISYINASSDLIKVNLPLPGAVVGREFVVQGSARGSWFFEASFPVVVLGKNGEVLAQSIAHTDADWMTTDFIPFTSSVVIPSIYSGDAVIVLKKDNPSGLPEKDASMTFPLHIKF